MRERLSHRKTRSFIPTLDEHLERKRRGLSRGDTETDCPRWPGEVWKEQHTKRIIHERPPMVQTPSSLENPRESNHLSLLLQICRIPARVQLLRTRSTCQYCSWGTVTLRTGWFWTGWKVRLHFRRCSVVSIISSTISSTSERHLTQSSTMTCGLLLYTSMATMFWRLVSLSDVT